LRVLAARPVLGREQSAFLGIPRVKDRPGNMGVCGARICKQ
jgi:hypothetical protein